MAQIETYKKPFTLFFSLIILILCFFLTSCKKNSQKMDSIKEKQTYYIQKLGEKEIVSTHDNAAYEYAEKSSSQVDTVIESSKKSLKHIDINKMMKNYEDALTEFDKYSKKLIKNPKLSEDKKFTDNMMSETVKVRELFQALNKANLNAKQKKKFQELSYSK
jgi:hypothetical protein